MCAIVAVVATSPFLAMAATLRAGSSGYAAAFSRERTDIATFRAGPTLALTNLTVSFWVRIGDPLQSGHTILAYGAYDYSQVPIVESSNEMLIYATKNDLEVWMAGEQFSPCTVEQCKLFSPGLSSNWTHVSIAWAASSHLRTVTFYINGKEASVASRDGVRGGR